MLQSQKSAIYPTGANDQTSRMPPKISSQILRCQGIPIEAEYANMERHGAQMRAYVCVCVCSNCVTGASLFISIR